MNHSPATPRERILTALQHRAPDRVPFAWGFCATEEMQEVLTRHLAGQGIRWPVLRDEVSQKLLPHGDAATVDRERRRLVEVLGRDGGYIAAPAHAIQVGTPPENVLAMLRAVLGDETFALAMAKARHCHNPSKRAGKRILRSPV